MENKRNKIICRCSDITEQEVLDAIEAGFVEIELLRRFLHLGMGPCQGRVCINLVQRILREKTGRGIDEIGFPVVRPPVAVMPAKTFAFRDGRSPE